MVNPTHLRTLLEVSRWGSFSAAATHLGYTASAVSQQMSALERDAGVRLFERSARSIQMTEAANVMIRHAAKVLTDLDALLAAAGKAAERTTQELRLGLFPSLATYVLPKVLETEAWQKLDWSLRLRVAEPAQTLQGLRAEGDLDIALVYQVGQSGLAWPHTLDRQWVADDQFRVVLPRSWGIRDGATITTAQLDELPWIMHHPGTPDAMVIERLFGSCNLRPQVVTYSDDFTASLALSSVGVGAALVPDLVLRTSDADLVVVDVPEFRIARSIFALFPRDTGGEPGEGTAQRSRADRGTPRDPAALANFVELLSMGYAEAISVSSDASAQPGRHRRSAPPAG
ncbi:LysR family transcriptional regulator [Acaricomes phytoseiuli]|uniref:LysR family transcriptional regulator n=1 Tax=Acaricomes phytoseiuli TaxID=291968 RepID=UPI000362E3CC|nr:LysR family transcriptional regulator [Acaricomes phytoseiuli]MCW1249311.1 LysR family transcriptional regulator [Acaricomes phytoseiuli]